MGTGVPDLLLAGPDGYAGLMRRAFVLAVLAACGSAPPADVESLLAEGERQLANGDHEACLQLFSGRTEKDFPRGLQPRFALARARAHVAAGDYWEGFVAIRGFADNHPHSPLREQVVALQFEIGRALLRRDGGFLFFWSDRTGGRSCLEHLVTRYPESTYLADALRLLGELDFEEGNYRMAQERFRDLLRRRPESEWAGFARFRFAMSIVAELRGSEYDLDQMQHATREMRAFLANPPENPQFVAAAESALQQLLLWQAERHLAVADFYARIGKPAGEVVHLRKAAAPEFAATPQATAARQRLAALDPSAAVPAGATTGAAEPADQGRSR